MTTPHSQVFTASDLDSIMRALEIANPNYAPTFDVLRVALHIQPEEPAQVWHVSRKQIGSQA